MTTNEIPSVSTEKAAPTSANEQLLQAMLPVNVLAGLLQRLTVSVEAGALLNACLKAEKEVAGSSPVKRLNNVFNTLQLQGIQVALLGWARFDQRYLPAMIFHQAQWYLVERSENSVFILTANDGLRSEYVNEDLQGAIVLWCRNAQKQQAPKAFSTKNNQAFALVWRELLKHPRWVGDIALATLLVNVIAIATSLFAMQVYDRVVPTLSYPTLWTLVMGMMIVVVMDWLLKIVRSRILDSVSCEANDAISQHVFDHVMHLQLDTRPRSLGTLAAQVGGLDSVRQFFSSGVIFALVDMPFALMFIAFIGIIGGHIAWVYLLLLPVAATLGLLNQKYMRRLTRQQMMRSNERQGLLVDAIQGTESIRASNATWRFSEQWKEITRSIAQYNIQQKAIGSLSAVTTSSISTLAYVAAIVVGVYGIEAGSLTMGAMIACSILGGRIIAPIAQATQYLSQWQNVSEALMMVNQVLSMNTERRADQNLLMPDEKPDKVVLESVQFSYPSSPVKQIDIPQLSIHSGDRVLLLGPIGSGKSTLLKVMAGLYRPTHGRIRLGNADLWEIHPHIVADQVGYLPQAVHLFKGTLRSNLCLSGAVSDSHLLKVCEDLGIDRIAANSPLGMDLEISEGGEGLSGGQKQLVGLGRVFLAQPRVWLLDEPTASLDAEGDAKVLEAIAAYIKPEDILVVSTHRVALALKIANRVILMQQGQIIADGKPDEVIPQAMRAGNSSTGALNVGKPKQGVSFQVMSKGPNNVI
jgi:ATP-binding cassette, subfamily C, bacterial LapB